MDFSNCRPKDFILVIVGPFGAGKSTVRKKLSEKSFSNWKTVTTRQIREHENSLSENERPYIFIELEDFNRDVQADLFVEYREQIENWFYGKRITEYVNLPQEKFVVTESEVWQIDDLKYKLNKFSKDIKVISCFLIPEVLKANQTIVERCKEIARMRDPNISDAILDERSKRALEELEYKNSTDFVQINYFTNLNKTVEEIIEKFSSKIKDLT